MVDEKGLVAITFSANGPRRHLSGQETTSTVTGLGLVPYSRARKRRWQVAGRQDEHYGQDRQEVLDGDENDFSVSGKSKDGRERRKKRWREKIGGSFSVSR